jgi:hypothetical protein
MYNVPQFGSFPPLFSLFLLLKMALTGFSVPYENMYGKHINYIHPSLVSSFVLPTLDYTLPLT